MPRLPRSATSRHGLCCGSMLSIGLSLRLCNHVIDHPAVLVLRAEHDDLGIRVDPHVVAGRPIEQIVGAHRFLRPAGVRGGELSLHDEAPVRTLAKIAFQALEQGRGVDIRRQREVFAAYFPEAGRIAEIRALPDVAPGICILTST